MIGVIIAGHEEFAWGLWRSASRIVGKIEKCVCISIKTTAKRKEIVSKFAAALNKVNSPEGVLILSDIFGGSASNVGCFFLEKYKIKIIAGANLPMILELYNNRGLKNLDKLSKIIIKAGKSSILSVDKRWCGIFNND